MCKVHAGFAPLLEESFLAKKRGILDTDVRSLISSGSLRDVPLSAICVYKIRSTQVVRG